MIIGNINGKHRHLNFIKYIKMNKTEAINEGKMILLQWSQYDDLKILAKF